MSLQSKLAYRRQKYEWCISQGRQEQAEWNKKEIERLENLVVAGEKKDPIEEKIASIREQIEKLKIINKNDPEICVLYGRIGHLRSTKHWSA